MTASKIKKKNQNEQFRSYKADNYNIDRMDGGYSEQYGLCPGRHTDENGHLGCLRTAMRDDHTIWNTLPGLHNQV